MYLVCANNYYNFKFLILHLVEYNKIGFIFVNFEIVHSHSTTDILDTQIEQTNLRLFHQLIAHCCHISSIDDCFLHSYDSSNYSKHSRTKH